MKITEALAFSLGSMMFLAGVGIAAIFGIISYNQKNFEVVALLIGLGLILAGWLSTKYAVKSTGLSIIHILLDLLP